MISIVVPIYNKEKFLSKAVESVIHQTYDKWELILVDDGSTDASAQLIDSYSDKDPRIKVVHKINGGEGSARNAGIDVASGDYILFIDADDWIETNTLNILSQTVEKTNADCIVFENLIVTDNFSRNACHLDEERSWKAGTTEFIYNYFGVNSRYLGTAVWNKLFKLSIINENGLRFNELRIGADTIFCLEYAWISKDWYRINEALYSYYQNDASVMHDFSPKFETSMRTLMDSYDEYAKRHNVEKELQGAICSINVRDLFTICKYYSEAYSGKELIRHYRRLIGDECYRNKILKADISILYSYYKFVFYIFKFKMVHCLAIVIWMYHRRYHI